MAGGWQDFWGCGWLRQGWMVWAPPWLSLGSMSLVTWGGTWLLGIGDAGLIWGAGFLLLSADGWSILFPPKRLPLIVQGARLLVMSLAIVVRPQLLAIALIGMLLPTQSSWHRTTDPLTVGQELWLWSLLLLSLLIVIPVPKLFPLLLNL
ncbi:MAG: hypothetical protein HC919_12860 [Oscillatoriales cyanobacterium SM2_2_1]|nr:hypothetical protein [Oscillatoriales cyanobacterium SM2_2_1]